MRSKDERLLWQTPQDRVAKDRHDDGWHHYRRPPWRPRLQLSRQGSSAPRLIARLGNGPILQPWHINCQTPWQRGSVDRDPVLPSCRPFGGKMQRGSNWGTHHRAPFRVVMGEMGGKPRSRYHRACGCAMENGPETTNSPIMERDETGRDEAMIAPESVRATTC